jgi:Fe2+ transport system protein FeoA
MEKKMNETTEIPLLNIKTGQKVKLIRVDAGEDLKSRLAALGMVPNVQITIINKDRPGPFVVSFKGSRIALGRGMTEKIMVRLI